MSDHDEVMERLDWCVAALKHLLRQEAGWQPDTILEDAERDEEYIVPIHETRPKVKVCPHNQQALVNGRIICVRPNEEGIVCGEILGTSGVRGKDPHSPVPAVGQEESLNHVSSQNPRY